MLRFSEPMESTYRREFEYTTIKTARIGVFLGLTLFGIYGFVEKSLFPDIAHITLLIRFTGFIPLAILVLVLSFTRVFARIRNPALTLIFATAGCSTVLIAMIIGEPYGYTQLTNTVIVFFFGYTLGTLPFRWASVGGWIIIIFYNVAIVMFNRTDSAILLSQNVMLNMANVAGMIADYIIEYATRRDFRARWELAAEQKKISRLNAELERRVDERTAQLSRVNVELEHLAHHDHLTGMGNSRLLEKEVERLIANGRDTNFSFALVVADIDRFKGVNDGLGHRGGDEVLRIAAKRIQEELESDSILARLSGTEFLFVLPETATQAMIQPILERISRSVGRPIALHGHTVHLTLSFGVGVFPHDATNYVQLIHCADTATSKAKSIGRGTIQYYSQELGEKVSHRMRIERSLGTALEHDEFSLKYQAKVSTKTGHIEGVEALIRWNNVSLGVVSPGLFIPIAEESGMARAIDEWALRTACLETMELFSKAQNTDNQYCLSVNVSANHFCDSDFVARVSEIVGATGFPIYRMQFEVTESAIMYEPDAARKNIIELRDQGVKIAIDDFGTGHSSLAYLSRFPIDELKIDRAFIAQLALSSEDRAIVQTIIALGLALGARVVAEGVEGEEQREILNHYGCNLVQGYLYSRPEPIEALRSRLAEG